MELTRICLCDKRTAEGNTRRNPRNRRGGFHLGFPMIMNHAVVHEYAVNTRSDQSPMMQFRSERCRASALDVSCR